MTGAEGRTAGPPDASTTATPTCRGLELHQALNEIPLNAGDRRAVEGFRRARAVAEALLAADSHDGPVGRVATPEFPFDPPLSPPSATPCRYCARLLVIVGREVPGPGEIRVVGLPGFRWAHADDLTVDCVRVHNDPVRPYDAWMTELDEGLIRQETNRRFDEREDRLAAERGEAVEAGS